MADIYKITEVISLIIEIVCFIGAVGMLITGPVFIFMDLPADAVRDASLVDNCGMVISAYGLEKGAASDVIGAGYIFSGLIYALLGMVFRNINLIVKTARGGTWFSKGKTPFQDDNVRMVREIGIFLIAIFVLGLIGTTVAHAINGDVETSRSMLTLVLGIIMICLSKIFEYGRDLQETEEGLI